jgi:hypothetical protein
MAMETGCATVLLAVAAGTGNAVDRRISGTLAA